MGYYRVSLVNILWVEDILWEVGHDYYHRI